MQSAAAKNGIISSKLTPIFSENVQILDTKFGPASYWREAFGTVCEHEMITSYCLLSIGHQIVNDAV